MAKHDGIVESVDASRLVLKRTDPEAPISAKPDIYPLVKYPRSKLIVHGGRGSARRSSSA